MHTHQQIWTDTHHPLPCALWWNHAFLSAFAQTSVPSVDIKMYKLNHDIRKLPLNIRYQLSLTTTSESCHLMRSRLPIESSNVAICKVELICNIGAVLARCPSYVINKHDVSAGTEPSLPHHCSGVAMIQYWELVWVTEVHGSLGCTTNRENVFIKNYLSWLN